MLRSRDKDVELIWRANRAAAVGRLMLGKVTDWHDFLQADVIDLQSLPRRNLRTARRDIRQRLSKEILTFCQRNFSGIDEAKLSSLYEEIKAFRGFEMPLKDFQQKYGRIKPNALRGHPLHSTVKISLWGLQFEFPELHLVRDAREALATAKAGDRALKEYEGRSHTDIVSHREKISDATRRYRYGSRSAVLCCFNLIEAYLNGIAWEFCQEPDNLLSLSKAKQEMIADSSRVSLAKKLVEYPEITTGRHLWNTDHPLIRGFQIDIKPFRDSIVHPSPFSVPEKFGGYDKLRNLYRMDLDRAERTVTTTCDLITTIHRHLNDDTSGVPDWLTELVNDARQTEGQ